MSDLDYEPSNFKNYPGIISWMYFNIKTIRNCANLINVISKYNYGVVIALNKDKKVSGIFTDGDLRRTLKKFGDVRSLILKNVMSKNPITVTTDILAAEALNIMEEREITCLIVKNKNKTLSGLLTLNQILKVGIE